MRPINTRINLRDASNSHCLYVCSHNLGVYSVLTTLSLINDSIEVKCTEPRHHQIWTTKISFCHVAYILLRTKEKQYQEHSQDKYLKNQQEQNEHLKYHHAINNIWDLLAKSVQLDEHNKLIFPTEHIVHFPAVLTDLKQRALLLFEGTKVIYVYTHMLTYIRNVSL